MPLRRDSHVTLYMQLAKQIEQEIASGKYGPHERLPTEQQFVDALGVSRITVRQALNHLAEGRLIIKKQGKGTFVAGPVERQELQELRGVLEEITLQGMVPVTKLLRFGVVKAPAGILKELRVENTKELVLLERLYSLEDAPIGLLQTYFAPFSPMITWQQADMHTTYEIIEDLVGIPIGADVSIRGKPAGRDIAKVLNMPAKSPLLAFGRLSLSTAGDPLESTQFHIKSESYEFTMKVKGAVPLSPTLKEAV